MSIEIDHTIVWRPAAEVLEEDESYDRQLETAIQEHINAPFKGASCLYTEQVYPLAKEGEIRPPPPLFSVKDYSEEKWRQEQGFRVLVPVGTRVLLRRRPHDSVRLGNVVQDTLMIRVNEPYRWECIHVFYKYQEGTPFPIQTKKRNYSYVF